MREDEVISRLVGFIEGLIIFRSDFTIPMAAVKTDRRAFFHSGGKIVSYTWSIHKEQERERERE